MNSETPSSIFFAHANGFPAACYQPFFDLLSPHPIDYVEVFGGGRPRPSDWHELADEIIEEITARHQHPVVGIGHSFGGVGTFFAAQKRPELFSQIMLLDPPFFGWQRRWLVAPFQWLGVAHKVVPPARKALKRKDTFSSMEEARDYFSGKKFFQSFSADTFDAYLKHGLKPQGESFTLRITKEQEAYYFAGFPTSIGDTELSIPVDIILPDGNGIIPPSHMAEIQRKFVNARWHSAPGNHMFPLEYPQETAELILQLL